MLADEHAGLTGSPGASYRRGVGSVVGLIEDGQNLSFGIYGRRHFPNYPLQLKSDKEGKEGIGADGASGGQRRPVWAEVHMCTSLL